MSYSSFGSNYKNPLVSLGGLTGSAQGMGKGMFASFKNNKMVAGATEFLYSNSLVAKVAFLILVVLLFVFFLRMGARALSWWFSPSKNPTLVRGIKNGKKFLRVQMNPNDKNMIIRSKNEDDGIEYTWSVWLFVDDMVYKKGQKKHIFHKGNPDMTRNDWKDKKLNGLAFPNNGPGLYLHETENKLVIVQNTFEKIIEKVEIPNIPLNKWINCIIRVEGKNMDVFINGNIAVRHVFNSVPKQNFGDVYVNMNNGFSGLLSGLQYYGYALPAGDIRDINNGGPNLTADDSIRIFPPYFSMRWFFNREDV